MIDLSVNTFEAGGTMRIGIIGSGSTIERENLDWSVEDTVFFTVKKTLAKHNMSIQEIDTIVQAADDIMDGIAINHVYQIEPSGAFLKEESKVERDGAWAVHYAMARLLSGRFKTAMVVAYSKGSQISLSAFSGMSADPFYLRPVGADADSIAALQAKYYSERTGATEEDFAAVAVKNRKNGMKNDRVIKEETGSFSTSQIMSAPPIATPITELSAARTGDGCVVMLLATEEYIKEKKLDAAWITGVGYISDAYYPTYRDLSRLKSVEKAAGIAYRMAGAASESIDFVELHECYAHQELMLYESLGFCEEGKATQMLHENKTSPEGELPVNASGGVLSGNVIYASGLARLMEAALQVRGQAGPTQLKNAKRGLVHSQAGLAMQANIVYIVES